MIKKLIISLLIIFSLAGSCNAYSIFRKGFVSMGKTTFEADVSFEANTWMAGSLTVEGKISSEGIFVLSSTEVDNLNSNYFQGHVWTEVLTKEVADSLYVDITGDTMTGTLTGSAISITDATITNLTVTSHTTIGGTSYLNGVEIAGDETLTFKGEGDVVLSWDSSELTISDSMLIEDTLLITPADGTADPHFQIKTTGTNQYGWDVGTLDLTAVGYGKYPSLLARSNGALGDGLGILEGGLIMGDGTVGAFGQSLGFLQESDLSLMSITANWDFDGSGNNRMEFNDDILFQRDLEVAGDLSIGTLSIGLGATLQPAITFDTYQDDATLRWNAATDHFECFSGTTTAGLSLTGTLNKYGSSNTRIWFNNDTNEGIEYSDYNSTMGGYGDYISHQFRHLATNLHDDAYMVRMYNMADPGYMFGVKSRGQLELGSTTGTDTDISVTFNGGVGGSVGKLTYMEDEDYFDFADDILIPQGERIYLDDVNSSLYDNGTNVVLKSSNNMYFLPAGGQFVIGNSEAGIDFSLKFDGENSNGIITWKEDEGYFVFDNNVSIEGTIATDNNEFVATDYIRHVITTVEASAGNFTEAWTKAGTSEIMAIDAIWHDVGSGVVWADEWTSGTDPAVKYDGANFTTYRQIGAGAWAYPDEIVIEVKYTKRREK